LLMRGNEVMELMLWAFGAMLVSMLVIIFLPLGFTFKGKAIVTITGYILALGGLATRSSVPLEVTLLLLVVLSLFAAYFMNSRLGTVINKEVSLPMDDIDHQDLFSSNNPKGNSVELEMLDLSEIEVATHPNSLVNRVDTSYFKDSLPVKPSLTLAKNNIQETSDEDISFLQYRDDSLDIVEDESDQLVGDGYLSEIENMLLEDSNEVIDSVKDGWLDELEELEPLVFNEKQENDIPQLDELELELLLAEKEVAAEIEESKEPKEKILELQK
ncbi:hypothetical protein V7075_13320, partial [Neobacillus drentensis]|uniref:hypothetical protein n=1 Tax=Neobacillus drentensis TaxID=220684 RepID=UPI002FFDBD60